MKTWHKLFLVFLMLTLFLFTVGIGYAYALTGDSSSCRAFPVYSTDYLKAGKSFVSTVWDKYIESFVKKVTLWNSEYVAGRTQLTLYPVNIAGSALKTQERYYTPPGSGPVPIGSVGN